MSSTIGADRRAFGRRDSAIAARILGPNRTSLPCTIRNFSEHGALIQLEGGTPPQGNFRLLADEPRVDVLCQLRHTGPQGLGVQFVSGNASALLETYKPAASTLESMSPRPSKAAAPLSNRELRRSVLARG